MELTKKQKEANRKNKKVWSKIKKAKAEGYVAVKWATSNFSKRF